MNNSKTNLVAVALLFLSLTFIFIGISFSIFTYFGEGLTNNVIETGRVVFSYSDANGGGNGILIEDAVPISDEVGKRLSGAGEYFDFSVTASTTSTDLVYEMVVLKNDESTLDEKFVKIYLTKIVGSQELETPLTMLDDVQTYDELNDTTNSLLNGKTIYYGNVSAGEVAYGQNFRLRMWVSVPDEVNYDYSQVNDKKFSVKVNVAAVATN